jgi:hypothetical protein
VCLRAEVVQATVVPLALCRLSSALERSSSP